MDSVIRELFPSKYLGLCHVYAIVGALVAGVVLGRTYRPVAGLAVYDSGAGLLSFIDNDAFSRLEGGAYHCWIETAERVEMQREIVDFSFKHNSAYSYCVKYSP